MESNWPVVYNASNPWNGPGPFHTHVERDGVKALEWNARGARFGCDEQGVVGVEFAPQQRQEFRRLDPDGRTDFVYKAVIGKALLAGPKLFRPSALACEPLEQVELGVPVEEYHQPFPTCVVEFPDDYATARLIPAAGRGVRVRQARVSGRPPRERRPRGRFVLPTRRWSGGVLGGVHRFRGRHHRRHSATTRPDRGMPSPPSHRTCL